MTKTCLPTMSEYLTCGIPLIQHRHSFSQFQSEDLGGRDRSEDVGAERKIILEWILEK